MALYYNSDKLEIHLSSRHADFSYGTCAYEWYLNQIRVPDNHYIQMGVADANIPRSWYDINEHNCVLHYVQYDNSLVTMSDNLLYIPLGNYTANELRSYLYTNMTNMDSITYNELTNTFTFANSTYNFMFVSATSTILDILGFTSTPAIDGFTKSYLGVLTSDKAVNMNFTSCICVRSNFSTRNVQTYSRSQDLLCAIPCDAQPNDIIFWKNSRDYKMNLFTSTLDKIVIRLTDMEGRELNLNGLNFTMTLELQCLRYR
jgi:hypothetical protein